MPKTLLAVDDSITMRKVLEITFAGDDFRVVSADGSQIALARMIDGPVAAIIDAGLDGDGYALAKEMRTRDPRLAIVLLASRYNPYDANRGRDAGADDYLDKPFDTQALIDKVKKAIVSRESAKAAPAPASVVAAPTPAPPVVAPLPPTASRAPVPAAPPQRQAFPTQRAQTLSFEGTPPGSPPAISRTAPSVTPVAAPAQQPRPPPAPTPAQPPAADHARTAAPAKPPEVVAFSPAGNGHLAGKLGDLGLTAQQIDAVLALSRDVVERVVWEVVPQLAEALIKEEIARLTKEG